MRYWVTTAALDHVKAGQEGGFIQVDPGDYSRLRTLSRGDLLIFYSAQSKAEGGESVQVFSAVGMITDDEPYEVDTGLMSFQPWQRGMVFFECEQAPIRPLINDLEFIPDPFRWGLQFRKGIFEIEAGDFKRITKAMGADLSELDNR